MSRKALTQRRQLLVATACLQRTQLALDLQALRRRGSAMARCTPVLAGAALATGAAAAAALRRRSGEVPSLERISDWLRLLTRGLALWRLWREGHDAAPPTTGPNASARAQQDVVVGHRLPEETP